jgi:hypothetical protein
VVTLVRQDGPTLWPRNDYRRCQTVARDLERQLGLRPGGPTPITAGSEHG